MPLRAVIADVTSSRLEILKTANGDYEIQKEGKLVQEHLDADGVIRWMANVLENKVHALAQIRNDKQIDN